MFSDDDDQVFNDSFTTTTAGSYVSGSSYSTEESVEYDPTQYYMCLYPGRDHPFWGARQVDDEEEEMQWEEASDSKLINLENKGTYSAVLFSNTDETSPPSMQLLRSPQVWVGDTGATTHSTFIKESRKNQREPTVTTNGITGGLIGPSIQMDIDCMHCDKHGTRNLNLCSISRILR